MSQVTYSYIGKPGVYLADLGITIYPAPDYQFPEFTKIIRRDHPNTHVYTQRCTQDKNKIAEFFTEHGPCTAAIISEHLGIKHHTICNIVSWNVDTFAFIARANDGHNSKIWGFVGQTVADMTIDCDKETKHDATVRAIVAALGELGEARSTELAERLAIDFKSVSQCLGKRKDVFSFKKIGRNDGVWSLK